MFDLLVFLLQNRDRIVSKDEILDAVWDGRIVSEAALSSRINAARKAVGDTGNEQAVIRTFHKRGFRFIGEAIEEPEGRPTHVPHTQGGATYKSPAVEEATYEANSEPLPEVGKPSIAVLPFVNLSLEPEHEYFAYGLTEDVIRLLGRNRWLTVLSRHSARPAVVQGKNAPEIGASLGVRYLVEGGVRKSGEHVRITAELIRAEDGTQLWSDIYEINLSDIFDIQNAMANQIAAALEPEVGSVEREAAVRKDPQSLAAWECYQRGFWHLWGFTTPGFDEAETLFRRAIEIEPELARAHAALSYVHLQQAFYGDPSRRPTLLQTALAEGQKAVTLDERDCLCHCVVGRAHTLLRRYDEGIAAIEHTIELNPSFAQGYFALAFAMVWAGREEEAIALIEQAAELTPAIRTCGASTRFAVSRIFRSAS